VRVTSDHVSARRCRIVDRYHLCYFPLFGI
jgi:hypothetical protein